MSRTLERTGATSRNISCWPLADIGRCTAYVRYRGQSRDMPFCTAYVRLTKSGVSLDANYSSLTQVGSGTLFNRSGSLSNPSTHDIHASRDHSREVN